MTVLQVQEEKQIISHEQKGLQQIPKTFYSKQTKKR